MERMLNQQHELGTEVIGVEKKGKPHGLMALVRALDDDGNYAAEKIIMGPMGPAAIAGRGAFVSAEELVEMIRIAVREELDRRK